MKKEQVKSHFDVPMIAGVIAFCACALTGTLRAADIKWNMTVTDGDWNATTSWNGGVVPGSSDNAWFQGMGDYRVTLAAPAANKVNQVRVTPKDGNLNVTFDLDPNTLQGTGSSWDYQFFVYGTETYSASAEVTSGKMSGFAAVGAGAAGNSSTYHNSRLTFKGADVSFAATVDKEAVRIGQKGSNNRLEILDGAQFWDGRETLIGSNATTATNNLLRVSGTGSLYVDRCNKGAYTAYTCLPAKGNRNSVIVENGGCTFRGSNVGIAPDLKGLYFGHNRMVERWENDREALTHDCFCNAFREQVPARVEGCKAFPSYYGLSAAEAKERKNMRFEGTPEMWLGRELIAVAGRGVGQKRTIVKMDGLDHLTLDRPFDVPTDETTRFTIGSLRDRLIYADNEIEDAAVAIQLYGGACRAIVARNVATRAGGFLAGGGYYSTTPVWCVDFNDNEIPAGYSYWYPDPASVLPNGSRIGTRLDPKDKDRINLTRGLSLRRNRILSNGMITLAAVDTLTEGNAIADSDFGIVDLSAPETHFHASNAFERVKTPYVDFSKGVPERPEEPRDPAVAYKPPRIFVKEFSYAFTLSYGNPPTTRDWAETILPSGHRAKKGYPLLLMDTFTDAGGEDAASVVLETFLDVKKPVRLRFNRWDMGAELYLDDTLVLSRDAYPMHATIERTVQPGVHRLRLFRAKFTSNTGWRPIEGGLGLQIHNVGLIPEDAYTISACRPGRR